jgi:hypothetical protein
MRRERTFRFRDKRLNERLVEILAASQARFTTDTLGQIVYPENDEEFIENELISSVRREVFPSWQVVTCPDDWVERYKAYMLKNNIPFEEEFADGERWFLIPGRYRPHSWAL